MPDASFFAATQQTPLAFFFLISLILLRFPIFCFRNGGFADFGSFDEPIHVPAFCGACKFIPTIDSQQKHPPLELAIEFFSRTSSFAMLDSCKLVCRDWNQLRHEPTFMSAYCKQSKSAYGFILQGLARWNQNFVSLEDTKIDNLGRYIARDWRFSSMTYGFKILASSKQAGVLLVDECNHWSRERSLYIGKVTTDYWRLLPIPDLYKYYTVAAAVVVVADPNHNTRYKLIRLSHKKRSEENFHGYHCEVFYSENWKWETVNDVDLGHWVYLDDSTGQPVAIGKLVHWLTTDNQMLVYNCHDNSCFRFPLPEIHFNEHDWRTLVDYEGKLGLMHTNEEEEITRVWVRGMGGNWRLVSEFEVEPSLRHEEARPVGLYNRDIILLTAPGRCVFYNMSNSTILRSLDTVPTQVEQIFPFRSDHEEADLCVEDMRHIVPTVWLV